MGGTEGSEGSTWHPVCRLQGPAGSLDLPRRGWISPGLSELLRHQGEAALGYHWPGEHRRQNKPWSRSCPSPTGSSLLGTITRQSVVLQSSPEGSPRADGKPLVTSPFLCCGSSLRPRDPPSTPLRDAQRSKAGGHRGGSPTQRQGGTLYPSQQLLVCKMPGGPPGWCRHAVPEDPSPVCRADAGDPAPLAPFQHPFQRPAAFLSPNNLLRKEQKLTSK